MTICRAEPGRVLVATATGKLRDAAPTLKESRHYRYWRPGHSFRADYLRRALEAGGISGYIDAIRKEGFTNGQ
jgi:hypothetical protein